MLAAGKSAGALYTATVGVVELAAMVPLLASPATIPSTSQAIGVPLVAHNDAVSACDCPSETVALEGEIRFAHVIATPAVPVLTGSAMLLAVMVTFGGDGGTTGAVYVAVLAPLATIVPTDGLPPAIPSTAHVTPVAGLPEPVTFAVKICFPPTGTVAEAGERLMAISSWSVTVADALMLGSAALAAEIVTVVVAGRTVGAVYNPFAEMVPRLEFPPVVPSTIHLTFAFEVPVTVAWNCCVWPRKSVTLSGCIDSVIVGGGGGGGGGGEPPPLCSLPPAHAPSIIAVSSVATIARLSPGDRG